MNRYGGVNGIKDSPRDAHCKNRALLRLRARNPKVRITINSWLGIAAPEELDPIVVPQSARLTGPSPVR